MSIADYPTVEYIRESLRYEDGKLFWLARPLSHFKDEDDRKAWNNKFAGKEAGCFDKSKDRVVVGHHKILIPRYHITWALHHGEWPSRNVDHVNRNPTDDNPGNLRLCNQLQNCGNSKRKKNNKSGYKGVSWSSDMKKWVTGIAINGKRKHIGYFDDPAEAHEAYMRAAREKYGEFAHDGS